MTGRTVQVCAPSRLHCGLLSIRGPGRRFGGAGLMTMNPQIQVTVTSGDEQADRLVVTGIHADRARRFAEEWSLFTGRTAPPSCQLHVNQAPPQHVGLGTGTQLALAVATALRVFCDAPPLSPYELATCVGRGKRSAIGTYGFLRGGFVVDRGLSTHDRFAELDCQIAIDPLWRFVLVRPEGPPGLSGPKERLIFDSNGPNDSQLTHQLQDELRTRLLPAVIQADFPRFSDSLYRYGYLSGLLFAREQQGPYHGPVLQQLVELIHSLGVQGVTQSSWGPTLFAVLPDQYSAEQFVSRLRASYSATLAIQITAPNNHGASVEWVEK